MRVPRYDHETALIVADIQNDFADPGGSLAVRGGEDIIDVVNEEMAAAAAAGSLVVVTQDWHPPVTPHFQKDGGIWPVHCVADSWGAQLHPRLRVPGDARVVRKGVGGEDGYSAFSVRVVHTGAERTTGLEQLLRSREIRRVVVAGLATDYCVKATALDAVRLGLETRVLREGVRAVDLRPGDGESALADVRAAGVAVD